jgi:hypothetical protein
LADPTPIVIGAGCKKTLPSDGRESLFAVKKKQALWQNANPHISPKSLRYFCVRIFIILLFCFVRLLFFPYKRPKKRSKRTPLDYFQHFIKFILIPINNTNQNKKTLASDGRESLFALK